MEEFKRKEIFEKAKQTGERQLLEEWVDACDNEEEECDIDNVSMYALPDGSTKIIRNHTW